MQHLQAEKVVAITPPAVIVDNDVFVTAAVDTLGFSELLITVFFGAMDIAMAALKLRESDSSDMSSPADISGADLSVAANGTLPADDADNTFIQFHVKCGGQRKRYIDLVATGGNGSAGTYMTAFAFLAKGKNVPTSNAQRGAGQFISV
jgi:hypothetical protein